MINKIIFNTVFFRIHLYKIGVKMSKTYEYKMKLDLFLYIYTSKKFMDEGDFWVITLHNR